MVNNKMLSQELVDEIVKAAIEVYKCEERKAEKNRKSQRIKDTKKQLYAYRQIKRSLAEEKTFTAEEKAEYRWEFVKDLMGNAKGIISKSELIIKDEEKKRQENMYAIYRIENAMKLYKEECDMSSSEEDKRRYREVYALHISDTPKTVLELAKEEDVSEKTVYRDLGIAYQIIAIYLYGI